MAKKQSATDFARSNYGYLAGFLNDKEIGPLLKKAAKGKWDIAKLQGALYKTRWWRKSSGPMREWDALWKTDKAEANRRISAQTQTIRNLAGQLGVDITKFDEKAFAKDSLRLGMSQEQIIHGLSAKVKFGGEGATYEGDVGKAYTDVKKMAADNLITISDRTAFDLAKRAAGGEADQDNIASRIRELAKSRYTWLAKDIDAGFSVRDLADGQIQQVAQLLERSDKTIDFMNDPKFSKILDYNDPSTGERRMMTLAETNQYVRSLDEWGKTRNGQQAIAQGITNLTSFFGQRGVNV